MDLKNNSLYIVPNNIKNDILLNMKDSLLNIKFMSLEELIDRLTFTYDKKAIVFLTNKYNIKEEVALTYLNNLRYASDNYNSSRLSKLLEIKKELDDNNLLIRDNYINLFLKDKEVIVYGYDYIPKFYKKYLDEINAVIINKEIKDYKHDIYEFKYIDDEIEFAANKILDLILDNVDINNIKIANLNSDYYLSLKRIFDLYNIPINIPNNEYIYDSVIISDFISLFKEKELDDTLKILEDKYDLKDENNNYIYNKLISILNDYTFISDKKSIINNLIYDFKTTKVKTKKYKKTIEIINLKDNIFSDNDYVFLMNYNSSYPVIYKDNDYINDSIKEKLNIETSSELNKIEKEININIIKSIKNLFISYKLKSPTDDFMRSTLLDNLNYEIKKISVTNNYSNKMNYFKLSNRLDNLIKYNKKSDDLDYLYSVYKDIDYRKFDNSYKGINKDDLYDYLNNKLTLSYTGMNNFYKCGFRYYLDNVLYLGKEDSTFFLSIGNIFHDILSKCFIDGFDFEEEFNNVTKDYILPKEKFFLKKLKKELLFVIDTIKFQNNFSSLDNALYENKVYVNKEGTVKLTFTGTIDKLLYKKENNNSYIVIIDYKTGNPDINLKNTLYGLDLQLPVYLYLSKNVEEIKNAKVIGFYLQRVLDNEIKKESGKTYENVKKDNLKLHGYTIGDEDLISKFDKNYYDSSVIKSMKMTSNGFASYTKLLSEEEINNLVKLTENHIDNAFEKILDREFNINPKRIDNKNISCEHCKYKDVCFMREENIINLKEPKNLDFLKGGD